MQASYTCGEYLWRPAGVLLVYGKEGKEHRFIEIPTFSLKSKIFCQMPTLVVSSQHD
jgi:hypothetical protein